MSALPGPEPCCWLCGSLSQPGTETSPDRAPDRPAPAALAGRRGRTQTQSGPLSLPSSLLPTLSSGRFLPAWPPLLVTTHSRWPLGPGQVPETMTRRPCYQTVASGLAAAAAAPRVPWKCPSRGPGPRRDAWLCTQLTCVCRDRQGLALGPGPGGQGRGGESRRGNARSREQTCASKPFGVTGEPAHQQGDCKARRASEVGTGVSADTWAWSEHRRAVPARGAG